MTETLDQLELIEDKILIELDKIPEKTQSGIYLPDSVKELEKGLRATVLAVGPGLKDDDGELIPMHVKPGDRIIVSQYAGIEIEYADKELKVLRNSEFVCKLNPQQSIRNEEN